MSVDPKTCEEAADAHAYVGCDFWPTVTLNVVWKEFDFALVIANTSAEEASYTVTGPGGFSTSGKVAASGAVHVYLPWVETLKGAQAANCGVPAYPSSSVRLDGGAFHLTTTKPVTVYQFSALEYKGEGGPPGKDWSTCPGLTPCESQADGGPVGCFSYSNDDSLLLPSTALTANTGRQHPTRASSPSPR